MTVTDVSTVSFTVDANPLRAAVDRIEPARSGVGPLAVDRHYHFSADPDSGVVTVTATNFGTTIQARVRGAVDGGGTFLFPAGTLGKILSNDATRVSFTTVPATRVSPSSSPTEETCVVEADRTRIEVGLGPLDEWPRGEDVDLPDTSVKFDPGVIAEVVDAASTDEDGRPFLATVCFERNAVVATDSYRLNAVVDLPDMLPEGGTALVPQSAAGQVARLTGPVVARFGHRHARFWGDSPDDPVITCRLVEGEFPRWRGLIIDHPHGIDVDDPDDLRAAVKEVSKYATGATPVHLVEGDDGEVVVRYQGYNKFNSQLRAERSTGGRFTGAARDLAYKPDYLARFLDGFTGPTIYAVDHLKPSKIEQDRPGGGRTLRILMPVRLA